MHIYKQTFTYTCLSLDFYSIHIHIISNGESGKSKIYISGSKELGEKDLLINAENPDQAALWKKTIDAHIQWMNARTSGAVEEYKDANTHPNREDEGVVEAVNKGHDTSAMDQRQSGTTDILKSPSIGGDRNVAYTYDDSDNEADSDDEILHHHRHKQSTHHHNGTTNAPVPRAHHDGDSDDEIFPDDNHGNGNHFSSNANARHHQDDGDSDDEIFTSHISMSSKNPCGSGGSESTHGNYTSHNNPSNIHLEDNAPMNFQRAADVDRKVIPCTVCSPDGISCKLMPSRKSVNAPHSKHKAGTLVNIFARRTVKEKLKESAWLLTNYGWVAERAYGHATIKTSVCITAGELHPINVKVLGANFVEAPTPVSMFDKKKDFQTMFQIECTYESQTIKPEFKDNGAPAELNNGCSACYHVLGVEYKEQPVVRVSRSYSDFVAFHSTIDLHHSALGVKFPDEYVDGDESILCDVENNTLFNIVDSLDKWMQIIIQKYTVQEHVELQNFLSPNEGNFLPVYVRAHIHTYIHTYTHTCKNLYVYIHAYLVTHHNTIILYLSHQLTS